MILETAAIATATKPLVEKVVAELITPKIIQFAGWCKGKYNENMIPTAEHFQEYLERTYDKYSSINVLAIPNSQFQLKEIYVTQTLVKCNRYESDDDTTKINRLPTELIKKYKKILITDTAGMGKSTILKYMFIDLIDNGLNDVGIPIFIELNRLNKNRPILIEIQEEMDSLSKKFDSNLLFKLIQTGGFIFFMDGYDEISISDRNEVIQDIHSFISKAGTKNYYILSSRPEDSLSSFGDFLSFNIQPLAKKEAFELLTKYDISNQKKISEELIKELKTGKYDSIEEYLVNPLLVSLLYIAFNYKAEIPLKKRQFYRQVYDALFNSHKLAQGQKPHEKRSGLDIDDFDRILRYVGYECLIHIGVQFDEDTILDSIKRAKNFCGNLKFGESDFLKDLMTSVPLFSKDGTEYKWTHKSLMEYFAARYIAVDAKENQNLILSKIYNSKRIERYLNMLDLYYDIDYKGFNKNIRYPFCKDFVNFYNSINYNSKIISKELVDERISKMFLCRPIIIRLSEKSFKEFINAISYKEEEDYLNKCFGVSNSDNKYGYSRSGFSLNITDKTLVIYKVSSLINIAWLLFGHSEDLFNKNKKTTVKLSDMKKLSDKYLRLDKVYELRENTGGSCNECYFLFNKLISPPQKRNRKKIFSYLDYFACKKVVDEYELNKNIEVFDLIDIL